MSTASYTDAQCQDAFKKFGSLLSRVQRGSPFRAHGADFTKAKREYQQFLPELQPMGQHMLDRVCAALDKIRQQLRLPEGYGLRDNDYRDNPAFRTFEAGIFQLNHDASLYVHGPNGPSQQIGEVRLFTQKVQASWLPSFPTSPQAGDSAFFYADDYDALALQVIQTLQPRLDSLPPGPQAAPADEDGDDYRPRP